MPETHVAALAIVLAAELVTRRRRRARHRPPLAVTRAAGALVLGAGAALGAWAVRSAGAVDVAEPDCLLVDGAYRYSRNPMYLAWHLGCAGMALLLDSRWLATLLPTVFVATHVFVHREERELASRFPEEFARYRARVRRYV